MERARRTVYHRLTIGVLLLLLFLVAVYIAWDFVPVFIIAVFLYYAVRPIHNALTVFKFPERVRAGLSLLVFGMPFIILTVYTLLLITVEAQFLLESYDTNGAFIQDVFFNDEIEIIDQELLHVFVTELDEYATLSDGLVSITAVISRISSAFVQLLVLLILTYAMLVDGRKLKNWVVDTVDHGDVLREYCEITDKELAATLFGNIVNVFVTGIIAVIVFTVFNQYAPAPITIPYPGLLGALAGIGSLIPVIGIKLVYIPVTGWLFWQSWMAPGDIHATALLTLFTVSAVFIDFIPDLFIRGLISGDETNTSVLIAAYIIGPSVLGFYGLFLAPILLVVLICSTKTIVPYVLHGELPDNSQATFGKFERDTGGETDSTANIRVLSNHAIKRWAQVSESVKAIQRKYL